MRSISKKSKISFCLIRRAATSFPVRPEKRTPDDQKITDLLYQCYHLVDINQPHEEVYRDICARRFREIAKRELELSFDLESGAA